MTISVALKKYHKIEIELLLAHVLKKPKEFVFLHPDYNLTKKQYNNLTKFIKRRLKGEPIAYILGYKDFRGLRFKVNKDVLIPRPETEMVVDLVIASECIRAKQSKPSQEKIASSPDKALAPRNDIVKILDIGTGSGCIAVSLAKEFRIADYELRIVASDISEKALKVAKENAKNILAKNSHTPAYGRIGVSGIQFIKSDLLKNVKGDFDIIIANLPYVPVSDYKKLKANLKFEPKNSIFAKENGLVLIRKLLEQIAQRKNKPKLVYLEFDPRQKQELNHLIKKNLPNAVINFHKDFAGKWRYAEIKI